MFGLGWGELIVVGVVALIVVGPKELPVMFRTVGQFVGRARGMARDFTRAMDAAADETGMRDIGKDLRDLTSPRQMGMDALREATDWDSYDDDGDEKAPRGPQTAKMTEERAEAARKIHENAARTALKRQETEARAQAEDRPPESDKDT